MNGRAQNASAGKANDPHSITYRRIRMALDCILILLVIWIASGSWLAAQARSARQSEPTGQSGPTAQTEGYSAWADDPSMVPGVASFQQSPALIDDNALAAVIAAENAALTPPIYFNELPFIER